MERHLNALSPQSVWLRMSFPIKTDLIVVLCWAGEYKEALIKYDRLPSLFQGPPYLYRNVAHAAYDQNNFSLALRLYKHVLKEIPGDFESLKGLNHRCRYGPSKFRGMAMVDQD